MFTKLINFFSSLPDKEEEQEELFVMDRRKFFFMSTGLVLAPLAAKIEVAPPNILATIYAGKAGKVITLSSAEDIVKANVIAVMKAFRRDLDKCIFACHDDSQLATIPAYEPHHRTDHTNHTVSASQLGTSSEPGRDTSVRHIRYGATVQITARSQSEY